MANADRMMMLERLLQGQKGSPDLPSRAAQEAYKANPTDQAIQDFIDRFGLARAENPGGPPAGEVPMPRPRYPDLEPSPMGMQTIEGTPAGTFRTSDIQRTMNDSVPHEGGPADDYHYQGGPDTPMEQSDEQMLEHVRQGMGKGSEAPPPGSDMEWKDVDDDRAALEANPTEENIDAFAQYWGPDELPESIQKMEANRPQR